MGSSQENIDFTNKTIVITGAGGVICSTIAKALCETKAKLALLDLNEQAVLSVVNEIEASGGIAKAYKCDVLNKKSIELVAGKIREDLGSCDILINGAGGNNPKATTDNEYHDFLNVADKDFFSLDEEGVKFVFDLNFIGTFLPTQVFTKDMVGKKGSTILNISSMNAFSPLTKIPAYSGAKAAVSNFTQWLAVHFSKVGIRVNAIAPGFFVTNQNRNMLFNADGTETERTKKILSATPMGRFGEAEELIGAVLFLLNEAASSFVTGLVLAIDGGFSAFSGV